jgi:multicomponent K+:H+ antiporter subunit D
MILEAALPHAGVVAVWVVVLTVGFLTLVGLARAGSILFWNVRHEGGTAAASGASPRLVVATVALLAFSVAMSAFAEPLKRYTDAAAAQLLDRRAYAEAVLGPQGLATETTRPYRITPGGTK